MQVGDNRSPPDGRTSAGSSIVRHFLYDVSFQIATNPFDRRLSSLLVDPLYATSALVYRMATVIGEDGLRSFTVPFCDEEGIFSPLCHTLHTYTALLYRSAKSKSTQRAPLADPTLLPFLRQLMKKIVDYAADIAKVDVAACRRMEEAIAGLPVFDEAGRRLEDDA